MPMSGHRQTVGCPGFPNRFYHKNLLVEMKKYTLALAAAWGIFALANAQYATVNYDYEMNRFGENEPLPAEQSILFTGSIPANVDIVEISVFNAKGQDRRDPLATANWKRPFDREGNNFNVPLNYKLQASKEYDLLVGFYRTIGKEEQSEVYRQLTANLDAYLDQTFSVKKNSIKLTRNTRQVISDMNDIVNTGLKNYRSRTFWGFEGFSDIVRQKLGGVEKADLSKAQYIFATGEKDEQRRLYREQLTNELKQLVHSEVKFLMNSEMAIIVDRRYVDDYETEKRSTFFALNAGYGGVWLSDKLDNKSSFGDAPYLGIGFPLSTSTIAPKFFRNASLTLGIFTKNFENEEGDKISGPIVNRPLYAGLDYKLFSFVRFNAGAALLEQQGNNGSGNNKIFVRPFIGLSAKVNISLGLDK